MRCCETCNVQLSGNQKKFCSRKCINESNRLKQIEFRKTEDGKNRYRLHNLKKVGINSFEEWRELYDKQNGLCASCKEPELCKVNQHNLRKLAVDHDHKTGKVRGLLCMKCNRALGLLNDSSKYVESLLKYRQSYPEENKIIYVSGPISGYKDFNFEAFFDISIKLRNAGHIVVNPAENDGSNLQEAIDNASNNSHGSWENYMRIDLIRMMKCDAIVVLPGWRKSKGATLEVDVARKLGMPVYRWDNGLKPLVEIISLSGYATSGKDTASELLLPYGWQRVSFADKLRECLYALNPAIFNMPLTGDMTRLRDLIDEQGWQKAKTNNEIRELLQRMGTEVGREILGENIWVEAAFRGLQDGGQFVFTDTRFPNELEAVKEYNAKTIWISRPGVGPVNNHASDNSLSPSDCDYEVKNDGNKNDLLLQLLDIV